MKLSEAISSYASSNGYLPREIVERNCDCGSKLFQLVSDDDEGGAYTICAECEKNEDICDSIQYIEEPCQNICSCDHKYLQVAVGVSFYENTDDPRWVYVGGKCPKCNLAGVYVDWQER